MKLFFLFQTTLNLIRCRRINPSNSNETLIKRKKLTLELFNMDILNNLVQQPNKKPIVCCNKLHCFYITTTGQHRGWLFPPPQTNMFWVVLFFLRHFIKDSSFWTAWPKLKSALPTRPQLFPLLHSLVTTFPVTWGLVQYHSPIFDHHTPSREGAYRLRDNCCTT